MAVGHARYSTSGGAASWEAAQPHISAIERRAHRARAQRHAREHEPSARPPRGRGRAVPLEHRQRGGREGSSARRRRPRTIFASGIRRVMEDLSGAYAMVLASPDSLYAFRDPERHSTAVHRRAAGRPRLGRCPARRAASTSWARATCATWRPARSCASTRRACTPSRRVPAGRPRRVHLRVRVLRPPRQRDRRPERRTRLAATWVRILTQRGRPWRPTSCSACPTRACPPALGLRGRERHPVRRRHREEPLRGPHLHPAHPGHAAAGHPPEAEPAARGDRGQAPRGHRRLASCAATRRSKLVQMLRDAGAAGGAPAHREPGGEVAVLLRYRHRHARPAHRGEHDASTR